MSDENHERISSFKSAPFAQTCNIIIRLTEGVMSHRCRWTSYSSTLTVC